jgi:hypothetical protein
MIIPPWATRVDEEGELGLVITFTPGGIGPFQPGGCGGSGSSKYRTIAQPGAGKCTVTK